MIRRILITIVTVLIPILLQAQCWLSQSVSDLDNADLSSEFKTLLKSQQYNKAYQFLYSNAFNTRTDISVLKKLKNTYEDILFDLKNVNEDFIKSEIVHLDLGGHNRYPEAVKIITADVDYANKPIDNLLDGYIQDFTPKFKNNSVDRITIESAPASNDIIAEVKRITKDGGKIELEHPVSANLKYDDIASRAGGYINKTESFVKNGVEFKRVVIIKGVGVTGSDLLPAFKSRLSNRIANESAMTMHYVDDELKLIIENGKRLNLPDNEIEDIIFNGCRDSKAFSKNEIISQTNFWSIVKNRGYPNLFTSLQEYENYCNIIKEISKNWNLPEGSIFIQGSSLRVSDASQIGDIDIAIKVNRTTFDNLVDRFYDATTSTGRQNTITAEALKGRISGGNMFFDTSGSGSFIGQIRNSLDFSFSQLSGKTKISIIKNTSKIDVSPYLKIK